MQFGKFRLAHVALEDLALLVEYEGGGREGHVAVGLGRFARHVERHLEWQLARFGEVKTQSTLSLLNAGQQTIIAVALVAMLWRATQGVVDGSMTLGDLVMINAFMIQLYIPLNFLGVLYREIKQSLTDLDKMFMESWATSASCRSNIRRIG